MIDRERRQIAAKLAELRVTPRYGAGVGMVCRGCGEKIDGGGAIVCRQLTTADVATHAGYPCTRWWLEFDKVRERFADE